MPSAIAEVLLEHAKEIDAIIATTETLLKGIKRHAIGNKEVRNHYNEIRETADRLLGQAVDLRTRSEVERIHFDARTSTKVSDGDSGTGRCNLGSASGRSDGNSGTSEPRKDESGDANSVEFGIQDRWHRDLFQPRDVNAVDHRADVLPRSTGFRIPPPEGTTAG